MNNFSSVDVFKETTSTTTTTAITTTTTTITTWIKKLFSVPGIYPTLALLNHSCDPNISKYFIGPKVFAVANRIIFKGNAVKVQKVVLTNNLQNLLTTINYHCFFNKVMCCLHHSASLLFFCGLFLPSSSPSFHLIW